MGRKSSAKAQTRPPASGSAPSAQPPEAGRSFSPLLVVAAIVALVAIAGVVVYVRSDRPQPDSAQAAQSPPPARTTPGEPPATAKLGPHPQPNLPPLPFSPEPPARPADVVRAAYKFAAEHPEVLSFVPCYCGCERSGHRGNEDCFVTARDANGDVTEWEPHGMT
jgi:hypothetical protein